jgi:hypothetical protein
MLNFAKIFIFKQISTSSAFARRGDGQRENNKLNPWLITGLIDAEGCFNISISKSLKKNQN